MLLSWNILFFFVLCTLLLWVPLFCRCYGKTVRCYLAGQPYQNYLYASAACLALMNSLPFWRVMNRIDEWGYLLAGALQNLGTGIGLLSTLLFWFWPYIFLVELLTVIDHLRQRRKRLYPNFFLLISLVMMCWSHWGVYDFLSYTP